MNVTIFEIFKRSRNQDKKDLSTELIEQLKETVDIDEVIKVLSGYNKRGLFIDIIDKLLDENISLERKIKKIEEEELEII